MLWTNWENYYDSNIPLWVDLDELIWEEEEEDLDFNFE